MSPFSAIITPMSVCFTGPDGKVHNVLSTDDLFPTICEAIKVLQNAIRFRNDNSVDENPYGDPDILHMELADLLEIKAKKINLAGEGKVCVVGGVVYYGDEPVHGAITERILWGLDEGFDMSAYINFLENVMENPSKRAVDEMYSFMEKHNMGITTDGYILGYKRVKDNFKDIYSGKFDNSPGQIVEIRRNMVDDDASRTCSHGLHFCSMHYLPSYGVGPGNTIVIVKVHPKDIVSVPIDYNHAKVRTCRYEVLSEYTGTDKEDFLGTKAVWTDEDFRDDSDDWAEYDVCEDCGEEPCECHYCSECGCEPCECNFCNDCGFDPCECESENVEEFVEESIVSSETENAVLASLDKLSVKINVTVNVDGDDL